MHKFVACLLVVAMLLSGATFTLRRRVEGAKFGNLERAFLASQAALLEINMNGWARLGSGPQSADELKNKLRLASSAAFGMAPPEIEFWAEGGTQQAHARFVTDVYSIDTNAQTILHDKDYETYVVLTITTSVQGHSLESVEMTLRNFFLALGVRPTVTMCFVGVLEGSLTPEEAARVVGRVLGALRVETQEFFSDGHSVNVVGFSQELPRGVSMAGRDTNLSLMLRFDPENNTTHIWLASPTLSLSI